MAHKCESSIRIHASALTKPAKSEKYWALDQQESRLGREIRISYAIWRIPLKILPQFV
jgi:hypothetical protein